MAEQGAGGTSWPRRAQGAASSANGCSEPVDSKAELQAAIAGTFGSARPQGTSAALSDMRSALQSALSSLGQVAQTPSPSVAAPVAVPVPAHNPASAVVSGSARPTSYGSVATHAPVAVPVPAQKPGPAVVSGSARPTSYGSTSSFHPLARSAAPSVAAGGGVNQTGDPVKLSMLRQARQILASLPKIAPQTKDRGSDQAYDPAHAWQSQQQPTRATPSAVSPAPVAKPVSVPVPAAAPVNEANQQAAPTSAVYGSVRPGVSSTSTPVHGQGMYYAHTAAKQNTTGPVPVGVGAAAQSRDPRLAQKHMANDCVAVSRSTGTAAPSLSEVLSVFVDLKKVNDGLATPAGDTRTNYTQPPYSQQQTNYVPPPAPVSRPQQQPTHTNAGQSVAQPQSMVHQPMMASNSTHPMMSSSNSTHPMMSSSNSTHPMMSSSNSTHPMMSSSNSTHPMMSSSNSTHPMMSSSNSTHPMMSSSSSNSTHPKQPTSVARSIAPNHATDDDDFDPFDVRLRRLKDPNDPSLISTKHVESVASVGSVGGPISSSRQQQYTKHQHQKVPNYPNSSNNNNNNNINANRTNLLNQVPQAAKQAENGAVSTVPPSTVVQSRDPRLRQPMSASPVPVSMPVPVPVSLPPQAMSAPHSGTQRQLPRVDLSAYKQPVYLPPYSQSQVMASQSQTAAQHRQQAIPSQAQQAQTSRALPSFYTPSSSAASASQAGGSGSVPSFYTPAPAGAAAAAAVSAAVTDLARQQAQLQQAQLETQRQKAEMAEQQHRLQMQQKRIEEQQRLQLELQTRQQKQLAEQQQALSEQRMRQEQLVKQLEQKQAAAQYQPPAPAPAQAQPHAPLADGGLMNADIMKMALALISSAKAKNPQGHTKEEMDKLTASALAVARAAYEKEKKDTKQMPAWYQPANKSNQPPPNTMPKMDIPPPGIAMLRLATPKPLSGSSLLGPAPPPSQSVYRPPGMPAGPFAVAPTSPGDPVSAAAMKALMPQIRSTVPASALIRQPPPKQPPNPVRLRIVPNKPNLPVKPKSVFDLLGPKERERIENAKRQWKKSEDGTKTEVKDEPEAKKPTKKMSLEELHRENCRKKIEQYSAEPHTFEHRTEAIQMLAVLAQCEYFSKNNQLTESVAAMHKVRQFMEKMALVDLMNQAASEVKRFKKPLAEEIETIDSSDEDESVEVQPSTSHAQAHRTVNESQEHEEYKDLALATTAISSSNSEVDDTDHAVHMQVIDEVHDDVIDEHDDDVIDDDGIMNILPSDLTMEPPMLNDPDHLGLPTVVKAEPAEERGDNDMRLDRPTTTSEGDWNLDAEPLPQRSKPATANTSMDKDDRCVPSNKPLSDSSTDKDERRLCADIATADGVAHETMQLRAICDTVIQQQEDKSSALVAEAKQMLVILGQVDEQRLAGQTQVASVLLQSVRQFASRTKHS